MRGLHIAWLQLCEREKQIIIFYTECREIEINKKKRDLPIIRLILSTSTENVPGYMIGIKLCGITHLTLPRYDDNAFNDFSSTISLTMPIILFQAQNHQVVTNIEKIPKYCSLGVWQSHSLNNIE